MADSDVQIAPDSTGKLVDTASLSTGAGTVQRQRVILGDNTTAANYAVIDSSGRVAVVAVDSTASGNITTQNSNPNSGAATAGSTVALTSLNGKGTVTIGVQGTYTGALTPQVSVDGSNWVALNQIVNVNTGVYSATISSAAVGAWQADIAGCANFRISANAAVTGTAVVTLQATDGTGLVAMDAPLPAGTNVIGALATGSNVIGALTANQSVNVAQVSASAVSTSATGVQQVGVGYIASTAIGTSAAGVQQVGLGYVVSTAVVTSAAGVQQIGVGYIGTSAVSTAAAGVQKVGIVGNAGATVDTTLTSGAAPTNAVWHVIAPASVAAAAPSNKALSAISTTTNVKASAGNLYGFSIYNSSTSAGFLQFYNTSTTSTGASVTLVFPIAATGQTTIMPGTMGINFSTGICIYGSTTVGGTTSLSSLTGVVLYS